MLGRIKATRRYVGDPENKLHHYGGKGMKDAVERNEDGNIGKEVETEGGNLFKWTKI